MNAKRTVEASEAAAPVSNADLAAVVERLEKKVADQSRQLSQIDAPKGVVQDTSKGIAYPPDVEDAWLKEGLSETMLIAPNSSKVGLGLLPMKYSQNVDPVQGRQKIAGLTVRLAVRYTNVGSEFFPDATFVDLMKHPMVASGRDKRANEKTLLEMLEKSPLYDPSGRKCDAVMKGPQFVELVRKFISLKRQKSDAEARFQRSLATPQEKAMGKPAESPEA